MKYSLHSTIIKNQMAGREKKEQVEGKGKIKHYEKEENGKERENE